MAGRTALPPGGGDVIDRCYEEIEARMQSALDDLAKEYPYPVLSRMRTFLQRR